MVTNDTCQVARGHRTTAGPPTIIIHVLRQLEMRSLIATCVAVVASASSSESSQTETAASPGGGACSRPAWYGNLLQQLFLRLVSSICVLSGQDSLIREQSRRLNAPEPPRRIIPRQAQRDEPARNEGVGILGGFRSFEALRSRRDGPSAGGESECRPQGDSCRLTAAHSVGKVRMRVARHIYLPCTTQPAVGISSRPSWVWVRQCAWHACSARRSPTRLRVT